MDSWQFSCRFLMISCFQKILALLRNQSFQHSMRKKFSCMLYSRCLQAYDSLICTGDGGQIVLITSPANHGAVHPRFPPRRKSSILFSLCLSFLHKRSSALCQIVLSLFLVSVLTKLGTHLLSTSFLCDANIL